MTRRLATVLAALALLGAACAGGASESSNPGVAVSPTAAPAASDPMPSTATPDTGDGSAAPTEAADAAASARSPLADRVRSAPDGLRTLDELASEDAPVPVGLSVPDLGVDGAPVRDVGVEPNGEMEIPGAAEVGWYRWSASPGGRGAAVLAAHVAYDGRDGVFRNLRDLEVGDRFVVDYDDGSAREFSITERAQYGKQELPFDRVFAREGGAEVVLITCGGDFNRSLSSYDDNVVVYAEPV